MSDPRLSPLVDATRAFYKDRCVRRGPANPAELQAVRAAVVSPSRQTVVESVASGGRRVPVRIQLPAALPADGALLELHGGGFYLGSTAADDLRHRLLAGALGIAVIGVDYRLAPEDPWPAAPDDCEIAARWLAEQAAGRFGTQRLAIGGFSAGATLALTTLLRLRDRGVTTFRAAVLQFGSYDLSGQTTAGRLIADEFFLQAYAGRAPDRTVADISPIYADLRGLPPVLMIVGEDDVLLPDNLAMAERLGAAGVDVDLRVYPAVPHGFTGHPTPIAEVARRDLREWLRLQLAG